MPECLDEPPFHSLGRGYWSQIDYKLLYLSLSNDMKKLDQDTGNFLSSWWFVNTL